MTKEEIKYINYQLIGLIISLITGVIAILITYNQKLAKEKKILKGKTALNLTYLNRIIILIIGVLFLYINYELYKIDKRKKKDIKGDILQIVASLLTILASIIALYVVSLSNTETNADIENPNI